MSEHISGKYRLVQGVKKLEKKYPGDVALNLAYTGSYAIGRLDSLEPRLIEFIGRRGDLKIISVNQGYANCSICQVTDEAVITGDPGLSKTLRGHGLEVLEISPGHIGLDGMDYGFVGFFGDLASHPDGELIRSFIEDHGKEAISLGSGRLRDYGSGIVFW